MDKQNSINTEIQVSDPVKVKIRNDLIFKYIAPQLAKTKNLNPHDIFNKIKETESLFQLLGVNNNPLQVMLASQITAVHDLQMEYLALAKNLQGEEPRNRHIRLAIKLGNLFNQQISTLMKLQGGSQQKVTVEHIHVNEGAQAIIGNIETKTK